MPELPSPVAARAERWFGTPCSVVEVAALSRQVRRIRFGGPSLRGKRWRPGQEIEFRVSPRCFRHYTPSRFDGRAGWFEVVFHVHGRGPGSDWALGLQPGVDTRVMGPGGGLSLDDSADWHLLLGDETALGAFVALGAQAGAGRVRGAVELAGDDTGAVAGLGLPLDAVARREVRGNAIVEWLERTPLPAGTGAAYLAGHAQTIQRLQRVLVQSRRFSRRLIRKRPYWADDKRGL
jgi:NADPH-dependent ferric siderophore reductase